MIISVAGVAFPVAFAVLTLVVAVVTLAVAGVTLAVDGVAFPGVDIVVESDCRRCGGCYCRHRRHGSLVSYILQFFHRVAGTAKEFFVLRPVDSGQHEDVDLRHSAARNTKIRHVFCQQFRYTVTSTSQLNQRA